MDRELNLLALAKGKQRFIFLYDEKSKTALLDVLKRFATDPAIEFTPEDARALAARAGLLPRAVCERLGLPCVHDPNDDDL